MNSGGVTPANAGCYSSKQVREVCHLSRLRCLGDTHLIMASDAAPRARGRSAKSVSNSGEFSTSITSTFCQTHQPVVARPSRLLSVTLERSKDFRSPTSGSDGREKPDMCPPSLVGQPVADFAASIPLPPAGSICENIEIRLMSHEGAIRFGLPLCRSCLCRTQASHGWLGSTTVAA
jgi:hypothetical protein